MHERAASRAVVRRALAAAPNGTRITRLNVSLGADPHVSPEAVIAWIEAAAVGTPAAGAEVVFIAPGPGSSGMRLVSIDVEDH